MFCLYQWVTVALSAGRLVWIWAAGPAVCRGAAAGACCGACALATVVMSANRMEADASLFTGASPPVKHGGASLLVKDGELLPQGNVTPGARFPGAHSAVEVRSSSRSTPALERPRRCPTRSGHRAHLRSQLCRLADRRRKRVRRAVN